MSDEDDNGNDGHGSGDQGSGGSGGRAPLTLKPRPGAVNTGTVR